MFRAAWLAILTAGFATAAGCGGSGPATLTHPDTGAGIGETPPAMITCTDLCLRGAECLGDLCNEDTMSTRYTAFAEAVASQCATTCASTQIPPITPTQWQCLFQSSCRQVFERDVCGTQAHYSCS